MERTPGLDGDGYCELCGEPIAPEDVSVEAFEVTGMLTCTQCLEAMAENASALDARTEVGLVGSGGGWR